MAEVKETSYSEARFNIRNQSDILHASIYLRKILNGLEKDIKDTINVVFSELTTNSIRYSNDSELFIEFDGEKIILKTINSGYLKLSSFLDGVSSQDSLGIGLGMIGRSADEFYYKLAPVELTWIKYIKQFDNSSYYTPGFIGNSKFNWAMKTEPLVFGRNGDRIIKIDLPTFSFFAVVDVAGHGKSADEVAKGIARFINAHYFLNLNDLIVCLGDYLKNSDREAVMEFLKLWKIKDCLEFCGVGDVGCKIFYRNSYTNSLYASVMYDDHESLTTKNGVVGAYPNDFLHRLEVQTRPIPKKAVIAMFTDGISQKLKIERQHIPLQPSEYIDETFKRFKRDDDSSLLLIRCP